MLPAQEAEALILKAVHALNAQQDVELVELDACHDRILASPVLSRLDFPHWDNSAMDGYAVRFEDVKTCSADQPAVLEVIEEIPAGYQPQKSVQPGQAARILTGSVLPTGADTIVIQEHTQRHAETVLVLEPPSEPQAFVRHQGAFHKSGDPLLSTGIVLKAPEIAVLAAAQCVQIPVFRRVRVAILSTGDELVSPEQSLQPGQIVDSNQYALAALVAEIGANPITMGIVRDDPDRLKDAIAQSLSPESNAMAIQPADIILSSGGVSVGDYDYVDRILAELGAEIHIRSVAIKPGKPLTFATFPNTLYFGLPGNPVSALVTFWRFVQPAILKRSGLARDWKPRFIKAVTTQDLRSDGKRESYLWGNVEISNGVYQFTPAVGSNSSGNLINLAGTNALGVVAIASSNSEASAQTHIKAGDTIQVLLTHGK